MRLFWSRPTRCSCRVSRRVVGVTLIRRQDWAPRRVSRKRPKFPSDQCSTDCPPTMRSMEMPLRWTSRPDGGMPRTVPVWTPPRIQRVTTLSAFGYLVEDVQPVAGEGRFQLEVPGHPGGALIGAVETVEHEVLGDVPLESGGQIAVVAGVEGRGDLTGRAARGHLGDGCVLAVRRGGTGRSGEGCDRTETGESADHLAAGRGGTERGGLRFGHGKLLGLVGATPQLAISLTRQAFT